MTLRPRLLIAMAATGLLLTVWGGVWLGRIGDLAERTAQTVAVVDGGMLRFTPGSGGEIVTELDTECKRRARSGGGCEAFFEEGDEVLIWYDRANPENVWYGTTPGGFWAAALMVLGVSLLVAGLLALWFETPWYHRLREFLTRVKPDATPQPPNR